MAKTYYEKLVDEEVAKRATAVSVDDPIANNRMSHRARNNDSRGGDEFRRILLVIMNNMFLYLGAY